MRCNLRRTAAALAGRFPARARGSRMPGIYAFDPQHADGIRYADVTEGERVLNEIIHECQRSLEAIEHVKVDLEAREWARGRGLKS